MADKKKQKIKLNMDRNTNHELCTVRNLLYQLNIGKHICLLTFGSNHIIISPFTLSCVLELLDCGNVRTLRSVWNSGIF